MKFPYLKREDLWAVLLAVILISLVVMTASSAPSWIYQGF